jgi:hypothetical protein
MAIEVIYPPSGNIRWITRHYGINGWKMQPMVIPDCARCLGIFIFWKTKARKIPVYSVTGVHLPPYSLGKSGGRKDQKMLFKAICYKNDLIESEPYLIVLAGGKVDTPANCFHYQRSLNFFVKPFLAKFPNIQVSYFRTTNETMFTTFVFDELGLFKLRTRVLID